jgi:hypothetical protein
VKGFYHHQLTVEERKEEEVNMVEFKDDRVKPLPGALVPEAEFAIPALG